MFTYLNYLKIKGHFIWSFLFLFSSFQLAAKEYDKNKLESLSNSRQWHVLLHYEKSMLGTLRSMVDSPSFFFSPKGKFEPLEELKATITALESEWDSTKINKHPSCVFPARYKFLKENLNLKERKYPCSDFEKWIKSLDPSGVSFVYASNFPNNPASIFGHTFMRIHSKKDSHVQKGKGQDKSIDILDYVIGFSALVGDDSALVYGFKGMAGMYKGYFDLEPYYRKTNLYNDVESRDLWEYRLNINAEETMNLLTHFWEMGFGTYIDYFFFDENCSYHILGIIEAAKPEWKLTGGISLYVAPPETVKAIAKIDGAIKEVRFYPSLNKKFKHRFSFLDEKKKDQFKKIIDEEIPLNTITDPHVLETALTYYLVLKHDLEREEFDKEYKSKYRKILIRRAQVETPTNPKFNEILSKKRPDYSHGNMAASFSIGMNRDSSFQEILFRPAYHDLLSVNEGQSKYSEIELLKFSLRYYNQEKLGHSKFQFNEMTFVNVTSITPVTRIENKWSYKIHFSYNQLKDIDCDFCGAFNILPRFGKAFEPIKNRLLIYGLLGPRLEFQKVFKNGYRYGPSFLLGIHFKSKSYYNLFGVEAFWDVNQELRDEVAIKYYLKQSYHFTKDLELRLVNDYFSKGNRKIKANFEHSLGLFKHF